MRPDQLLSLVPLVAMLLWAAVEDLRVRRIRNWLTLSMILTGVARALIGGAGGGGGPSLLASVEGIFGGAAIPLVLFALGAVGGGDVKLMAGIGAWLGTLAALQVFCTEAVVGLLIVLSQAIVQGRLLTLFRNSVLLTLNFAHLDQVGVENAAAMGKTCRSVEKPLPFAVPVLLAVLLLLASGHLV